MNNVEKIIGYLQEFLKPDILASHEKIECPPYDLNDFYKAIELASLYEGSVRTQRIQEYTATLVTRLEALRDNGKGRLLAKTAFSNLNEYVDDLIGKSQLVNIDISSLDDSEGEMVVKVISKLLLDYVKSISPRATKPINLIVEEAHRYIKNVRDYGAVGYDIFEKISKEGRKFGLLLGISSQRPRDLSETVVSQCSNFIIHRIQSPEDLNYISRMVPYIDKAGIDRLTYLQTGHGLVFGTAVKIPSLTIFPLANPQPDSKNAQIKKTWYRKT
jgi:DNA helicase HerA-like ATPase